MKRATVLSWLAYVATGLAVVALAYVAATPPLSDSKIDSISNWVSLAVGTAVIFGYTLRFSRHLWSNTRFWIIFGVWLAVHLASWTFVLLRVTRVPKVDFLVVGMAEFVLLNWMVIRWGTRSTKLPPEL